MNGQLSEAEFYMKLTREAGPQVTIKWLRARVDDPEETYVALRKAGLPEDAPPPPPKHLSIVVLPFDNLSGDPKQDYFADGITDNLTTDLSRIRNSFVIARNTAFTYKGKAVDAKEIGKELGVRYVLEGSVAARRQPSACQRPAHRRGIRRASLGRPVRGRPGRPVQAARRSRRATGQQLGL